MRFSELLHSAQQAGDLWSVTVTDDWLQGRSAFGGLQVALILHAMRGAVGAELPLRTLQVTFAAPVPGGKVGARATVLRKGKSTVHAEGRIVDDGGQTLCLATGVFGASRASVVRRLPAQPEVSGERPLPFLFVPGFTPDFTQHFSSTWLRGGLPFTGDPLPEIVVAIDMRDDGPTTEAHVLAIADLIPPIALSQFKAPVRGSSMTWMLEMLGEPFADLPLAGWRVDAKMIAAMDGYISQSAMIWGPGGRAVALSRQSMVVFG